MITTCSWGTLLATAASAGNADEAAVPPARIVTLRRNSRRVCAGRSFHADIGPSPSVVAPPSCQQSLARRAISRKCRRGERRSGKGCQCGSDRWPGERLSLPPEGRATALVRGLGVFDEFDGGQRLAGPETLEALAAANLEKIELRACAYALGDDAQAKPPG